MKNLILLVTLAVFITCNGISVSQKEHFSANSLIREVEIIKTDTALLLGIYYNVDTLHFTWCIMTGLNILDSIVDAEGKFQEKKVPEVLKVVYINSIGTPYLEQNIVLQEYLRNRTNYIEFPVLKEFGEFIANNTSPKEIYQLDDILQGAIINTSFDNKNFDYISFCNFILGSKLKNPNYIIEYNVGPILLEIRNVVARKNYLELQVIIDEMDSILNVNN